MSFWHKFADIVKTVGPAVLMVIPGVPPALIPLVVHGIVVAESLPGASGAEKKAHVVELVKTGLQGMNAAGVHVDADAVSGAVSQGIDATITAVNGIKAANTANDAAADAASSGSSSSSGSGSGS